MRATPFLLRTPRAGIFVLLLAVACGSSGSGSTSDAGADAAAEAAGPSGDTGASQGDAAPDDAASDAAPDGAASDATPDVDQSTFVDSAAGDGAICTPPATLPTPVAVDAGWYAQPLCPFLPEASAPGEHYCGAGNHCCEGSQGTDSACESAATTCDTSGGGIDWWCQYPAGAACPSCCASGALVVAPGDGGCGNYVEHLTSATCYASASCPAGTIQLCASDADCPAEQHCHPFQAGDVKELGGCQ
jgi:hypothetical protein